MSKPNYRVNLTFDPDRKVFLARAPELEHCSAEGATRAEAIGNLEQEIDAQLANMLSHGTAPPKSVDEEEFTGELTCKVSRTLHRDLAWQARSEGLDIPHMVGELLAASLESRRQTHRGPRSGNRQPGNYQDQPHHGNDNIGNRHDGGQRRQGFGGRGTQVLDDRATFIEYVRGLEQGGGQHARGGGGGGGGHSNHGGHNNNNNGRRRGNRGGRGGQGGGGFRHDGQQQRHGGGPSRQDQGFAAAPPAAPPAPSAGNGQSPPAHGGNGDDGGGNV